MENKYIVIAERNGCSFKNEEAKKLYLKWHNYNTNMMTIAFVVAIVFLFLIGITAGWFQGHDYCMNWVYQIALTKG